MCYLWCSHIGYPARQIISHIKRIYIFSSANIHISAFNFASGVKTCTSIFRKQKMQYQSMAQNSNRHGYNWLQSKSIKLTAKYNTCSVVESDWLRTPEAPWWSKHRSDPSPTLWISNWNLCAFLWPWSLAFLYISMLHHTYSQACGLDSLLWKIRSKNVFLME